MFCPSYHYNALAMLEQQQEFYKDVIQQQQDIFKSFVQLIMEGTNKRLDSILKDVHDVKSSLQFTDGIVSELQAEGKSIKGKLKECKSAVNGLQEESKVMMVVMDFMDNQARKNNIVIDRLTEDKAEAKDTSEVKVRHMLKNKLGLDDGKMDIEYVQRLGPYRDNGWARQIIVKLQHFNGKQLIILSQT